MQGSRMWRAVAASLMLWLVVCAALVGRDEPTVDELKERVANASAADRTALCIRLCERQLENADKLYVAGDSEKGMAALADVSVYAEMARDSAIQTRKHEKQIEISVRKMIRKLHDLKHTVSREEQEEIQKTVDRLERVRDDLLGDMFPKGGKR
jgi:hypothetical protein